MTDAKWIGMAETTRMPKSAHSMRTSMSTSTNTSTSASMSGRRSVAGCERMERRTEEPTAPATQYAYHTHHALWRGWTLLCCGSRGMCLWVCYEVRHVIGSGVCLFFALDACDVQMCSWNALLYVLCFSLSHSFWS